MPTSSPNSRKLSLAVVAMLLTACSEGAIDAPRMPVTERVARQISGGSSTENREVATMRRATARYHDVNAARADGFVFLHGCEVRLDDEPVGTLYVNMERLLDGAIDANEPDALLYEPQPDGSLQLVGAELAIPYALWTGNAPPTFLGATFQREDEFGVYGLHVWLWRNNPEGMFAESNPKVHCGGE